MFHHQKKLKDAKYLRSELASIGFDTTPTSSPSSSQSPPTPSTPSSPSVPHVENHLVPVVDATHIKIPESVIAIYGKGDDSDNGSDNDSENDSDNDSDDSSVE